MIHISVSDLAKLNNISREAAVAMIHYLCKTGLIIKIGTVAKAEGQKGRGETLYEGNEAKIGAHLDALKFA